MHRSGSRDASTAAFDRMWADLAGIGRIRHRRLPAVRLDRRGRRPAGVVRRRGARPAGSTSSTDRNGNLWAWWGDPDAGRRRVSSPASHLDSVPDGGAFDGPLGVVSALRRARRAARARARPGPAARRRRASPTRRAPGSASPAPGPGCSPARSTPTGRRALTDADGVTHGRGADRGRARPGAPRPRRRGAAPDRRLRRAARRAGPRRWSTLDAPVGVGRAIWPHGRWRLDLAGEANHAGTTRLADRRDPMLDLRRRRARRARARPSWHGALATVGKVARRAQRRQRHPVAGHRLARRPRGRRRPPCARSWRTSQARRAGTAARSPRSRGPPDARSTPALRDRLAGAARRRAACCRPAPGTTPGILAAAGIPTAMLFVRNPTGRLALPRRARRARPTAWPASTRWPRVAARTLAVP